MTGLSSADRASDRRADRAVVRSIVAASGSSFALGMSILPPVRRDAIRAVYAFCRIVDDIADGDSPMGTDPAACAAALDAWEEEIVRAHGGIPRTAVGAELARAIDRHDLPQAEFLLLLDGMRMDAACIVAPSGEMLTAYIRRVAGSVGVLSMHCFGAWRGHSSERFALSLARGLQLTNILRDVAEDARRGRLYLPAHVLRAAGLPDDPKAAVDHPALPRARAILGREARAAYAEAALEIPSHSRARLLPALMMMGPYERLLGRMEDDWTVVPPRRSGVGKLIDGTRRVLARGG
ncbi:squalene/phytoene synthase family protein [Jannaschia rubra]|uniref:squalene/phytoene synthase family protein n=1 Tax=Jannaschia rubra TaxID=282197 RepID=UPI00248F72C0|nr:squalene/phytoene synthase family protein [Jannaschia rubra]